MDGACNSMTSSYLSGLHSNERSELLGQVKKALASWPMQKHAAWLTCAPASMPRT